ncbi:putative F-box/FBD/LRR-repeat protein At4g13965 [Lotus japonicus]|uniref:putative F-box/FBD/LRR-repeat protein At4g13965 n=1 Tax=Lotus japonicus TaxID=34305 RepID=UPI0025853607|nr:putative F-box/FBD/LRR-repeat protein At4g13965 [Lotus japonicus]
MIGLAIYQMIFSVTFSRSFLLKMLLRQVLCPRDGDHSGFQFSISTLSNIDILDMGINVCYDHSLPLLMHPFSDEVFTNPSKLENLQFNCLAFGQDLPCSIFSITTLVVLKLKCVTFKDFSSVQLPSLKALHLDYFAFSKSQHFIDLLNGCPLLEILEVRSVAFDCVDDPSSGRNFTTLSKLVRADFCHTLTDFYLPVRIFYNVEFLRIEEFCDVDIPIFPNLIHLDLIFRRNLKWESVFDMLNHCPQLQIFVLHNLYRTPSMVWPNTHVIPECFSSQLRTCWLTELTGTKCEMTFAKFIMQNSTLLRTMKISSNRYLSHEKNLEMRKELNSCPRSSASCELLFPDGSNYIW